MPENVQESLQKYVLSKDDIIRRKKSPSSMFSYFIY